MRFTILADAPSVVMVAALSTCVALPLLVAPVADPYQPIRLLSAAVAAGVIGVSGVRRDSGTHWAVPAMVSLLVAWVLASALRGGIASAVFGVPGRLEGIVSFATVLLAGWAGTRLAARHVRFTVWAIAALTVGMGFAALVQAAGGAEPLLLMGNRVVVGAWFAVAVSVLVGATSTLGTKARPWLLLAATVGAIALGVAGSRGAWLGGLVGVAVPLLAGRRGIRRGLVTLAVLIALIIGGAAVGGAQSSAKLDPGSLDSGSAASRAQIWRGTTALIADNPLLGVGPGRFIYEFPKYQPLEHAIIEAPDTRADQAHSWPLQIAAECGVPAGILAAALAGLALWAGIRGVRERDGVALIALAGFSAYLVQGLFGVPAAEVDVLGVLFAGVLISRARLEVGAAPEVAAWRKFVRPAGLVLALGVVAACSIYLRADASYARALDTFAAGDMRTSFAFAREAVRRNPLVDVYRVAASDAALYVPRGTERDALIAETSTLLDEGIILEPGSYDLAHATARLATAAERPAARTADAYLRAVALYPLGITVREDAADALEDAGRNKQAAELRDSLAEQARLAAGGSR